MQGMLKTLTTSGLLPRFHRAAGPILLHPGSGSPDKNRLFVDWLELARQIKGCGHEPRFILGEAELERLSGDEQTQLADVAAVTRPATLLDLLESYRGAGGFIGHDSGPTHLAAMIGLPTTCCYVSTASDAWRPVGPQVTIVGSDADIDTIVERHLATH